VFFFSFFFLHGNQWGTLTVCLPTFFKISYFIYLITGLEQLEGE